jgi:ribonuclease VapC
MFLDASAIVAMMTNESDSEALSARLATARSRVTSAMALWEASVAYSRIFRLEPNAALREVEAYIRLFEVQVIAIEPTIAAAAVDAHQRFG